MIRPSRSAEELAAALDGRAPFVGDPSTGTVAPLLSLAQTLQSLPLGPRPEFRDSLRSRLLAVAAVGVVADPTALRTPRERAGDWIEGWRVQRSIAAASAGMAAVVGIAGVGIAGSRSLPGDPFYGVKRGAEGVQLTFARGEIAKGTKHLQHAETRLDEVARLVGEDLALGAPGSATGTVAFGGSKADRVVDALREMDRATAKGTRLLTHAYEVDREAEPLKVLAAFADRQKRNLAAVAPSLPDGSRAAADESLRLIAEVEMRADALLSNGVCGEECSPVATPTQAAGPAVTPRPEPQPTPSGDDLGPRPCTCAAPTPAPQPTRTSSPEPTSEPTTEPTSNPTPTSSPSPTDEPSHLPTPLPDPVDEPVEEVIDEVEELLPTPLPSLPTVPVPAPEPAAPPIAGAAPKD